MTKQQISLKSVNELRVDASQTPMRFYIPAYQRGYRWSPLQVVQLLSDIQEFTKRPNAQRDEFYCLQPLVIKIRPEGDFEVVDGQQRLTTLLLILRHFNERLNPQCQQAVYQLTYETRPSLAAFLDDPTSEAADDNVDYFHLYHAHEAVQQWFAERESEVEKIKDSLLNHTKVIWFQLSDVENPVDAFTRLNVGKIPLTNDELIRALFLRRTGSDDREAASIQLRIAHEWDQVEKALQADAFWYFLSNEPGKEQNRIGFLFELFARSQGMKGTRDDSYQIFYTFSERLKAPGATPESEWNRIKQFYLMLEEWFEDRVLYHVIGYLVSEGVSLSEIRALSINCTKSVFERRLRQKVYKQAIGEEMPVPLNEEMIRGQIEDRLNTLSYTPAARAIKSLLLLFNLATLLENSSSNIRFQFDSFKRERWDIEHVRSVADDVPVRHSDRVNWLGNCLGYLKSQETEQDLLEEIEAFLNLTSLEATNDVFDALCEKILQHFHEASEENNVHGIANLTLLDANTNRSYKNAVFAVKRQRLLNLDRAGTFVPLCTRNVFLKCYSVRVDNVLFWGQTDQEDYQKAISTTLENFFLRKMTLNQ